MRTRDLEPGGYYKVDGARHLAVVKAADDGTVRADWKPTDRGVYGAGDGSQREVLSGGYTGLHRKREGVLVDLYQYDAAGRRFGEVVQRTIVYPKDIQVPWGFYVTENEVHVQRQAESFAKERAKDRERHRLSEAARAFHPDANVSLSRGYGRDRIEIHFDSRTALERFLETNAGAHT